jgi:nucleotide-binding universal stress UspA family protein
MTPKEEEKSIRRILVAVDASPHSLAALRAAVDLAKRFDAELTGVYVEDINLLRMAELPFTREVRVYSSAQPLDIQNLEQELRVQARRARLALAQSAGRSNLRTSFLVRRGVVSAELLKAALEADLVILGKAGWSRRRQMGSTTRILVSQSPSSTLILQHGTRLGMVMGVIYDGSEIADKALVTAAGLMQGSNGYLTVIILADEIEQARLQQRQVTQWLRERQMTATFRWLVGGVGDMLVSLLKSVNFGGLILPVGMETLPTQVVNRLLDEVDMPVLLVR